MLQSHVQEDVLGASRNQKDSLTVTRLGLREPFERKFMLYWLP